MAARNGGSSSPLLAGMTHVVSKPSLATSCSMRFCQRRGEGAGSDGHGGGEPVPGRVGCRNCRVSRRLGESSSASASRTSRGVAKEQERGGGGGNYCCAVDVKHSQQSEPWLGQPRRRGGDAVGGVANVKHRREDGGLATVRRRADDLAYHSVKTGPKPHPDTNPPRRNGRKAPW